MIYTYLTLKDFNQASLDNVARLVAEHASQTLNDGNIADCGQITLEYLENITAKLKLDPTHISVYLDAIAEQNNELLELEDFPPPTQNRGNDPRVVIRG